MRNKEPRFQGHIGRTIADSKPWWPNPPALSDAPNVVMILLDDTGFAHFGCYGSTIETPNIDRLAAGGVRSRRKCIASPILFATKRGDNPPLGWA